MTAPRILIVEDMASTRMEFLEQLPGAEAVGTLAEVDLEGVDLLVLDVELPDGNGIDWLREQRTAGMSLPVIVATDYDDMLVRSRAQAAGGVAWSKATASRRLASIVATTLRIYEERRVAVAMAT